MASIVKVDQIQNADGTVEYLNAGSIKNASLHSSVTGGSGINALGTVASGTFNGTLGSSATFPAGHVIQISEGVTTAQDNVTNGNLSFLQHSITRTNNANKIFISGICTWQGNNPNGNFQLRRSYDNSTYTQISIITAADEKAQGNEYNVGSTPFSFLDTPSSSYSQVYYEIFWYHKVQNGGTMYRNRPHTIDSGQTVGVAPGYSAADGLRTSLTLMEVVA